MKPTLTHYFKHAFQKDLLAGLTVSMIAIPQSMAYATIGGLEPIIGLYAAMVPTILSAILGSSRYLVTGATNAIALTTASVLVAYVVTPQYAQYAFLLAIISGVIMLLIGVFNLGSLIQFISNSVLTAFLTGAACLILINQFGGLVGIERPQGSAPYETVVHIFKNLTHINPYVVVISLISILILLFFQRLTKKIPAAFVAMLICGLLVYFFDWHAQGVKIIADISIIQGNLFRFQLPNVPLAQIPSLLTSGVAIAILALVQTVSVAKPLANAQNEKLNPKKEFISQGIASITSGFVGGMPTAGSLAQSAVNYNAGAKTKMAAAFSGIFVLSATLLFSKIINHIPMACLSSIVMISAVRLIDIKHLKITWENGWTSRAVLVVTFLSTLLLTLQNAIFIGTALSIFLYLFESKKIKISSLEITADGNILDRPIETLYTKSPTIITLNIQGSLFFGSVDTLESQVENIIAELTPQAIIFYMRFTKSLGSTIVFSIKKILQNIQAQGIDVYLCGIDHQTLDVLKNGEIYSVIDPEKIFVGKEMMYKNLRKINQQLSK